MNKWKIYFLLAISRILLVLFQTGYIHPDEFFQSVEVVAGDVFNLRVKRTWEFNSTFPLRSMFAMQPFVRGPLAVYKQLLQMFHLKFISSFMLLLPRICTTLLSFLNDYFIHVTSKFIGISPLPALLFYGTSQSAFVFSSRTLSNSWETICLSLFGILAILQIKSRNSLLKLLLCILQGGVISFSTFCRPTTLLFMLPAFILQMINQKKLLWKLTYPIFMFKGFVVISLVCVVYDTYYYKEAYPTISQFYQLFRQIFEFIFRKGESVNFSKLVVTPVNFIIYNMQSKHLEEHGVHPWYTHLTVNMPQLLGPLYILGILTPFLPIPSLHRKISIALLIALLIPIGALSLFVHQEARFLLPVVPLWIVLCTLGFNVWIKENKRMIARLIVIWIVFNFAGVLFWGFLHQGALTPLLERLSSQIDKSPDSRGLACSSLVFYRTYMPPEMLLGRHKLSADEPTLCGSVIDLGGLEENDMRDFIARLRKQMINKELPKKYTTRKIYVIFPFSGQPQNVRMEVFGNASLVETVFGHVSGEFPPDLYPYAWPDYKSILYYWSSQLSLLCYSIVVNTP